LPREAGFTLLEVMVAFTIAALATAVLLRAGFTGAAEDRQAALVQEAVSRAQSRLASIGTLTKLQTETRSGDDGGGFSWRLVISPLQTAKGLTLYNVQVTEIFGQREVSLTTARAASGP
jgi:general secretion pathway protein I